MSNKSICGQFQRFAGMFCLFNALTPSSLYTLALKSPLIKLQNEPISLLKLDVVKQ